MGMNLFNFFSGNNSSNIGTNVAQTGQMGNQTPSTAWQGIDGAAEFIAPQRLRDVVGKLKVSQSQNIYDADFEYGIQPLRWENFIQNVSGNASIVQNPGLGGVTMTIGGGINNNGTPVAGDITIRQSRPYHRYQPGKTMYMASNVNFGGATLGQFQRVGIFDDSNGIYFMQNNPTAVNPFGMYCVIRSDSGGTVTEQIFDLSVWNGNKGIISALNWNAVQMIWMEYAWYGAGALRWGVVINGEPWVLHQVGTGNAIINGSLQVKPWSRTGNLPVRYEQRNSSTGLQSIMTHYGVSVLIEGGRDAQRGFTYSYGNDAATQAQTVPASSKRYPAMSFRMRTVGTDLFDYNYTAITSGTQSTLTIGNSGSPANALSTMVGQGNNGQALLTFASSGHGYPVTNVPANQPAQYITLTAFTQAASITTYTVAGTTLTVTANSGVITDLQVLTGTGIVGSPTIVTQLTATNSATASPTFVSGGTIGSNTILLSSGASLLAGQIVSGTGIPAGTFVNQVIGATVILSSTFTVQASGTYNFYTAGSTGTYQVSSAAGIASATGTLTATQSYAANTYLIQTVPSATTMVLQVPNFPNGASPVSLPTPTYWGVNQWVGKFLYCQASLPTIATISGLTSSTVAGVTNYTALVSFTAAHNLNNNDVITIANSNPSTYNGIYSVTVITSVQVKISFGPKTPGAYTNSATATTPYTARITSNTATTLTFQDIVTGYPIATAPSSGNSYYIGLIDRGQLLPTTLLLNASATCLVELIASTPTNQVSLQGASFVPLNTLGSYNSFAEQDLSSISLAGGEVVYAFSTANNGLQQLDLSNFFPVLTNIKGNVADILTVAVTSSAGATVQVNVVAQEAMA
jgi:hypothetical protein